MTRRRLKKLATKLTLGRPLTWRERDYVSAHGGANLHLIMAAYKLRPWRASIVRAGGYTFEVVQARESAFVAEVVAKWARACLAGLEDSPPERTPLPASTTT